MEKNCGEASLLCLQLDDVISLISEENGGEASPFCLQLDDVISVISQKTGGEASPCRLLAFSTVVIVLTTVSQLVPNDVSGQRSQIAVIRFLLTPYA